MFKKHFWQAYVNDYTRFYVVFGIGIAIFLILTLIMGRIPWAFALGFTMMDPFSYHMTGYQTVLRNEAIARKWRKMDDKTP